MMPSTIKFLLPIETLSDWFKPKESESFFSIQMKPEGGDPEC